MKLMDYHTLLKNIHWNIIGQAGDIVEELMNFYDNYVSQDFCLRGSRINEFSEYFISMETPNAYWPIKLREGKKYSFPK